MHMITYKLRVFDALWEGCLPASCTREQLLSYFSQFGRFRDAKVTRKSKSLCSGDGWLTCDDQSTYERILRIKNFEFAGRTIFCEPMLTGEQLQEKNRLLSLRRIFVSNLPPHMEDFQIFDVFSQFGPVQNAYRIISLRNERRPFGFVTFMEQSSAVHAVKSGKVYFEQRPIYISDFKKNKPDSQATSTVSFSQLDQVGQLTQPVSSNPRVLNSLQHLEFQADGKMEPTNKSENFIGGVHGVRPPRKSSINNLCINSRSGQKTTNQPSSSSFQVIKVEQSATALSTIGSLNNVNQQIIDHKTLSHVQQDLKPEQ